MEIILTGVSTAELLRQESNHQAQIAALDPQPSLSRKRVLRRRRVSDRCAPKRPSVVDAPHVTTSKHNTPVKHVSSFKGNHEWLTVCKGSIRHKTSTTG